MSAAREPRARDVHRAASLVQGSNMRTHITWIGHLGAKATCLLDRQAPFAGPSFSLATALAGSACSFKFRSYSSRKSVDPQARRANSSSHVRVLTFAIQTSASTFPFRVEHVDRGPERWRGGLEPAI